MLTSRPPPLAHPPSLLICPSPSRSRHLSLVQSSAGGKIRAKNARNAEAHRRGQTKPRPAYAERNLASKKPAIPAWALGLVCFVVIGGGEYEVMSRGDENDADMVFDQSSLSWLGCSCEEDGEDDRGGQRGRMAGWAAVGYRMLQAAMLCRWSDFLCSCLPYPSRVIYLFAPSPSSSSSAPC